MKLLMKMLFVVLVLGLSSQVQANLIVNGGFENNNVKTNSWKWFTSANVDGWEGSTVEIWDNFQNFQAYENDQYAELNAHANGGQAFSIFQSFETIKGATYDVSFAYAARTNKNEQFSYSVSGNNTVIDSVLFNNALVKEWTLFESAFVANSNITNIMFAAIRPNTGTMGNFLDNVVVTMQPAIGTANQVSAPASTVIFLLSALGLMVWRRIKG